ncbi:MAG: potassium transporter TrkG, partial [Pseudomonadota bacterium]
ISYIYLGITLLCALTYLLLGMDAFDASVHAMTTVATGGFANYDASFGFFAGPIEYAATIFMILAALPFVRYVQLINGNQNALWQDAQIRGFIATIAVLVAICCAVLTIGQDRSFETSLRQSLFNIVSIVSGTGYASTNYMLWGPFLIALFFFIGLIGGCAGSTACSIKIFRYQLLFASVKTQVQRIHSPNGIFTPRYDGRPVSEDVLGSVMSFFVFFIVTMGLLAVALSLTGVDLITALSGSAAALANIGPGLGDRIGPAGNYTTLNDVAKWLLAVGMLIGRLELMAVYAILTLRFWRA